MGYLKFDKTLLINLEESLQREVLYANRFGAYHSTTVTGCNTRKYHGLLVTPVPPSACSDCHVLLSSLDETVIQHDTAFNLGIHQYDNNHFSPNGHKYIREYTVDNVSRMLYRVGGVILAKEKIFSSSENRIIIKYTLLESHSATILRFRPFLAFRSVNSLTFENDAVNRSFEEVENGIKTSMYAGYPDLYMQFSKPADFIFDPVWNKNMEYSKEMERGYPYKEDLYVPGYFEMKINRGESVYFSGSDRAVSAAEIEARYEEESAKLTPQTSFFNCLKNAANQFYYSPSGNGHYLIAGYPWFKVRARDEFIALPGCTLSTGNISRFEQIMSSAVTALKKFMTSGEPHSIIHGIEEPDTLLWAVWTVQQYSDIFGIEKCRKKYGSFIHKIIDYILSNSHPNLRMDDSGLLFSDGHTRSITWMNSSIDDIQIIPRTGYIVEFNALWYNALKFAAELSKTVFGSGKLFEALESQASRTAVSFIEKFVNEHGYLFDYLDGQYPNWHVRPNMLFAAALNYSPLDRSQKRNVLNIVTRELLTPKGIRSLSPKSEGYHPYCTGPQRERDLAYHQGAAFPWLLGFYLEAYIKLYGERGIPFAERMLIGLEDEMQRHCIGTLSELYDGNPPFQSRGATSFAMNTGMILRILSKMKYQQ
ncbi:MAG: amylo-alpha-1,6-glucosidase [Dysgonamonadaceae bacterium]|nr:amylo-alpha-1,6-glucosidase [Dysgonamonadaceae bacterium]